jgi:LuxR family maltose regulon positive regulatory protein
MIAGYLLAGRLKLTLGDIEAARTYLELLRPLIDHAPFSDWPGRFERFQLECWLAQGKLPTAADWSDQLLRGEAIDSRPDSELTWLAIARVLLARGDRPSVERALVLLARLMEAAEAEGRAGVQIEALALQAIAHGRHADGTGAMTSLERALRLAEPEGYVRLFADLGLPMARLLQEAHSRAVLPEYVDKLLAAFAGDLSFGSGAGAAPPEPLSPREHEILRLIAAGLTNREIAEILVVSPQTVKKHTGNIYGKLAVGNRTEAVARARDLGVLD